MLYILKIEIEKNIFKWISLITQLKLGRFDLLKSFDASLYSSTRDWDPYVKKQRHEPGLTLSNRDQLVHGPTDSAEHALTTLFDEFFGIIC